MDTTGKNPTGDNTGKSATGKQATGKTGAEKQAAEKQAAGKQATGKPAAEKPAAGKTAAETTAAETTAAETTAPEPTQSQHPSRGELDHLVGGDHSQPHSVLGAHPVGPGRTAIRALRPEADAVNVVIGGNRYPLDRLHPNGVFGAVIEVDPTDYRLEVSYGEHSVIVDDPYRWLPTLGDLDLHLIGEGRHEQL